MDKSIIVMGDLHGYWTPANFLINQEKPKIVLQCGDFGFWPKWDNTTTIMVEENFVGGKIKPFLQYGLKPGDTRVFWCDGNHEDHEELKKMVANKTFEIHTNVFYQPRGSTIELPDGRVVLFMGGAYSTDKDHRIAGFDWFPEELITQRDLYNLPHHTIDIVISHTAPEEFYKKLITKRNTKADSWLDKFTDPSRNTLSYILHHYKPSLWYFGHFHLFSRGWYGNTKWYCLNRTGHTNWWTYLDEVRKEGN